MDLHKDYMKLLDFAKISTILMDVSQGGGAPQGGEGGLEFMTIPSSVTASVQEEQLSLADQLKDAGILRCHWDSGDPRLFLVEFERRVRLKRTDSRRHSRHVS